MKKNLLKMIITGALALAVSASLVPMNAQAAGKYVCTNEKSYILNKSGEFYLESEDVNSYNGKGLLTAYTSTSYDETGAVVETDSCKYTYNSKGLVTKEVSKDEEGKTTTNKYYYNKKGDCYKLVVTKPSGKKETTKCKYTYKKKKLVKEVTTYSDGSTLTLKYTYKNGLKTKVTGVTKSKKGKTTFKYTSTFTYTKKILKKVTTKVAKTSEYSAYTNTETYYTSGKAQGLPKSTNFDGDKTSYKYEFDENGNMILEKIYESGKLTSKYECTYNKL